MIQGRWIRAKKHTWLPSRWSSWSESARVHGKQVPLTAYRESPVTPRPARLVRAGPCATSVYGDWALSGQKVPWARTPPQGPNIGVDASVQCRRGKPRHPQLRAPELRLGPSAVADTLLLLGHRHRHGHHDPTFDRGTPTSMMEPPQYPSPNTDRSHRHVMSWRASSVYLMLLKDSAQPSRMLGE